MNGERVLTLAVIFHDTQGNSYRVRSLDAGSLVGEVASYADLPRTADVVAETDVSLYRITADFLTELNYKNPERAGSIHFLVAKTLANKLNRTNRLLKEYL